MEPLVIVLIPGLVGGLVVAVVIAHWRSESRAAGRTALEPPSPGLINMAHIRVDGVGGLGMVAMAITVAVFVPRIRLTMLLALLLGTALAGVLILMRRRSGPLPSAGSHPGAHSTLDIEGAVRAPERPDAGRSGLPLAVRPV